MVLAELLQAAGLPAPAAAGGAQVASVVSNSRKAVEGSVFCCIVGGSADGHDFAAQAVEKGAVCVVAQRDLGLPCQLLVEDTRAAYGALCAAFNGFPADRLKMIAVTGTNGKTTVTTLIKQVLEYTGAKVGLIGTIQNEIGEVKLPAKFTTPEPDDLHGLLANMCRAGCEYAVMEASSQALDQNRLAGVIFQVGAFTNLSQDHLDYHGTLENYFQAKAKLFAQCRQAVTNLDCPYGRRIPQLTGIPVLTCSAQGEADLTASDICQRADGVSFTLCYRGERCPVDIKMPGLFSVYNVLSVAGVCLSLGLPLAVVAKGLCHCKGVYGRAEVLYSGDFTVICDFAHTPDALQNLLETIKPFVKRRLIVLFGCAGKRDRTKRPKMANTVADFADLMVISSDNPRDEDPYVILEDTVAGVRDRGVPYHLEVDRYYAIRWAIDEAGPGDVVVLCGKGHENYQAIDTCTVYFDEHEIVKRALEERRERP
ncbi:MULTISPECIES: UDP-N-acetylmuramoyl-L-alanyl-D-glutamate--2,6-diaminopimelate ligase [Eubacteriales]|uniref:UDP-N-acetylmuramoyl-L-alanyl-D-glutamate--2,6-diaminopimelate ligase n=1 Tax=Bittarella massiliensis (ex Durand et al. 2017) TaxID=1720313 RepID=A0AAQ1RX07_9FIRM|nr:MULTISPECIES: UDP-N-acetylmuramoyl-L-alanyl-D-glutamate--2,6-diaminopimelate ligase [Eubacteriales]ERI99842.1 UDP-N-acetylmuramoyl-L-alanyl-D-glutamate--2,6-diaminopimelate ligase [Clostridium sp. ATCC 29733]MZL69250.1 UDP-N-acetylmuramoyl-L-alanyl-D-glutamate--2,6-diaminopimelate ligase [Bittarella massiliensis (ex Durand et al. 2017)]MZL79208.1 UDP-N-acetylmuramoyl-L-alanyl-D-glutamate--2,6-diaminopimelate ligase [Bittarella massiliensis (ex Durand et al. 2017)]SHG56600.1 UDP-N-acetylmuram